MWRIVGEGVQESVSEAVRGGNLPDRSFADLSTELAEYGAGSLFGLWRLQPSWNIALSVKDAPNVYVIGAFDVEDQVGVVG